MKRLLVAGILASCVSGHMQMSHPYPIRSPLNPNPPGQVDYSYTSPLKPDGSDFPCKGYAHDPFHSQATYKPGGTYEMDLEGSATHGGGSCQISLSYDKGKTYHVIKSMEGNCPIPKKYKFTIPEDAPSGHTMLVWTWFNKIGNREMYMDCAQVTIKGGSSSGSSSGSSNRGATTDLSTDVAGKTPFNQLPPIFIANVDGPAHCSTIGGTEVKFPLPGPNLIGHVESEGKGYSCKGHAPFLGSGSTSGNSLGSSSGSGSSSSSSPSGTSEARLATDEYGFPTSPLFGPASATGFVPSAFGTPNAFGTPYVFGTPPVFGTPAVHGTPSALGTGSPTFGIPTSPVNIPAATPDTAPVSGSCNGAYASAYANSESCVHGGIMCAPDGLSWSMCAHGDAVHMGPVAPGTLCRHGAMIHA